MTEALSDDPELWSELPRYGRRQRRGFWRNRAPVVALAVFCFFYGAAFALFFPFLAIPLVVPVIVLGAVAVWAMPDSARAPLGMLEALFFAFIIALVMWPNYLAVAVPGLPWITVVRLVTVPLTVVLLVCVSSSPAFRSQLSGILGETPWLWRLICAFVVIQTVSIVFSSAKGASADRLVTALSSWIGVFFTATYVFSRQGRAERGATLLCLMAVALAAIGLLEHRMGRVPWVGHIPSFLKVNDPNVARILMGTIRLGSGVPRVQGTFSTALGLAEYLALAMPFMVHFAASRAYDPFVRAGAALAVPLLVLTVVFTQARVGFVGLFICAVGYPLAHAVLRWRRDPQNLLATYTIFLSPFAVAVALVVSYLIPGIRVRMWGGGATQLSNQSRSDQWHMGLPKLLKHPWGYGIGQGADALGYFNASGVPTIDSYTLRLALEYGIVGLLVFYAIFGVALLYVGRAAERSPPGDREAALLVPAGLALLSYIMIKSVFAQEDNQPLVFMLLGMAAAIVGRMGGFRAERTRAAASPGRRPSRRSG
jgi:hypothetical protein